jgi:hypothetical protein
MYIYVIKVQILCYVHPSQPFRIIVAAFPYPEKNNKFCAESCWHLNYIAVSLEASVVKKERQIFDGFYPWDPSSPQLDGN